MATRAELVQEVVDRGFDYVTASRIGSFVDRSYAALCARYGWPFLEETTTGKAPLEIADLDEILSVTDATQKLTIAGIDRRMLVGARPALEEGGDPEVWYLEDKTLKTYPASSNELSVRYQRVAPKLGESDEPLIPEGWQYLIPDGAVVYCLKDDDEYAEARALQADVDKAVLEMFRALVPRNRQNAGTVMRTGAAADYL